MHVCKYTTKVIGIKKYESGKLVLPAKLYPKILVGENYMLIKLHRTHVLSSNMDRWGYSYLLFIKDPLFTTTQSIQLKCGPACSKHRSKYSRISAHTRIVNDKKYSCGKIYVKKHLIGKPLQIISILKPIDITYSVSKKGVFGINDLTPVVDKGRGYILFYEDETAKILQKSFKTHKIVDRYKITIQLLNSGNTIQQVAKKEKIAYTTVWSHICEAFKTEYISTTKFRDIIVSQCDKNIRDKMIVYIESKRSTQYNESKKTYFHGVKIERPERLDMSLPQLMKELGKEVGTELPPHMIKAVTLLLSRMYKK